MKHFLLTLVILAAGCATQEAARVERKVNKVISKAETVVSEAKEIRDTGKEVVEGITLTTYTVKKGDTLWDLGYFFWGNPYQWPILWWDNGIVNPNLIEVGQEITWIIEPPAKRAGEATSVAFDFGE